MSYRTHFILVVIVLLALPGCSGKQTARTHVESSEHQLALGLTTDWQRVDGSFERGKVAEHPAPEFHGLSGASRESALLDAQKLLELLNSGRADEALALIQQLGLLPGEGSTPAMNPQALQALMAQLQGGGSTSAQNLLGMSAVDGAAQGLALPGLDVPDAGDTRLGSGGISGAFDSHRKAFDNIGP